MSGDEVDMQRIVERYVAREEIQNVLLRYAQGHDRHDSALLRTCFAPDATWQFHGHAYVGVDEIVRSISRFFETPYVASTHFPGWAGIELDASGTRASVESISTVFLAEAVDRGYVKIRGIAYNDQFVRIEGRWLIERREHRAMWMTEGPSQLPHNILESVGTDAHTRTDPAGQR